MTVDDSILVFQGSFGLERLILCQRSLNFTAFSADISTSDFETAGSMIMHLHVGCQAQEHTIAKCPCVRGYSFPHEVEHL
jgi:hypothetical protein